MKVGIVGAGRVGAACALALVTRGSAREIVVVDRTRARARAVATDLRYGAPLCPQVTLRDGDYADLDGAGVIVITAGANEKSGGATDRSDPAGRLKLLATNAGVFREIVPSVVAASPCAVLLVVTDPPDPLADLTRALAGHDRVLSTGTLLEQPALSCPRRRAARRRAGIHRCTGHRRTWHFGSIPMVVGTRRRRAHREGVAAGCFHGSVSAGCRARRPLCQHRHHRRQRCEPVRHRDRRRAHHGSGTPRRACGPADRPPTTRSTG